MNFRSVSRPQPLDGTSVHPPSMHQTPVNSIVWQRKWWEMGITISQLWLKHVETTRSCNKVILSCFFLTNKIYDFKHVRIMFNRQTLLKQDSASHSGRPCIPSIPFHAKALSNWRILAQKLSNFKWVQVYKSKKTVWCALARMSQICGHLALPVLFLTFGRFLGLETYMYVQAKMHSIPATKGVWLKHGVAVNSLKIVYFPSRTLLNHLQLWASS